MRYNRLPGAGLSVSEISLGTMMFGGQTDEKTSLAIMDYAFGAGVNVFDTANVYNAGESERITGLGLKGRRDKIVLATKVRGAMGDGPNDYGLGRRHILQALDASLARLGTDYVDIYYLHQPDYETPVEESLETMDTLVKAGKVRYVGISNYAAWQVADIMAICERRGFARPVITQNVYNLLTRGVEAELMPCIETHRIGMTVYNPIAAGLLTGKHKAAGPGENTRFANNKMYYDRFWSEENFAAVETLSAIAAEAGITLLELAMRWCMQPASVVSILSGVSKLEQIKQNLSLLDAGPLAADVLEKCNEVYPSLSVGGRFKYKRKTLPGAPGL